MSDKKPTPPPPPPSAEGDTLDLFTALIHVWLALDAIKKTLPEPQAAPVSLAVDGLAEVMGRLMKRHKIDVALGDAAQGGGDE